MSLKKIISGGQTGADIAGIDAAIEDGMPYGGWLPKGRMTEYGPLDLRYTKMTEMSFGGYEEMTEQNVKDADGTVIFTHGKYTGVSALTGNYAVKHNKPVLHLDLDVISELAAVEALIDWVYNKNIEILNVAGSRESKDEHIYDDVHSIIKSILNTLRTAEVVDTPKASPAIEPPLQEPVAASEKKTQEVVAETIENNGSDTSGVAGLASLVNKGWPEIGWKNYISIALGVLILIIALMIIPRGLKKFTSRNTTVKSNSLSENRELKRPQLPIDGTMTGEKPPGLQTPSASQTTTTSTEKAAVSTQFSDTTTDVSDSGADQPDKNEKQSPQSLSDASGTAGKENTHQIALKKEPAKKQDRCGSLYRKMALGKVLKKSEAKFLANNCK